MKNCLLSIGLFLLFPAVMAQGSDGFYSYVSEREAYFENLRRVTPDTLKIPGMKDFQQWKDFWINRIDNTSDRQGELEIYGKKMLEAFENPGFQPETGSGWHWHFAGPENLGTHNRGITSSLYVNPQNIDEIYAGSNSAGLFRTKNGGLNWECVTDNLGLPAMGINDIAADPLHPGTLYLAMNPLYRSGPAFLYKTTDDCKSWQKIFTPPSDKRTAIRIVVNPENPAVLYASVQDAIYRSLDSGASWKLIFDALTYLPSWYLDRKLITEIEFRPGNPDVLIIGSTGIRNQSAHEASGEVWISRNALADTVSWTRVEAGLPDYCDRFAISVQPSDTSHFFLGYSIGTGSFRARFNVDRLEVPSLEVTHLFDREWWQNYSSAFAGMGFWCNGMEMSPVDPEILFVGGYSIQVLHLDTKAFDFYRCGLKEKNTHVDQRVFKVVHSQGKTYLFSGNDGGVTRFEYETGSFKSCNGPGLNNLQFYRIGHAEANPDFLIGGTQDNGVVGNAYGNWNSTTVGDAYEVIVDPDESEQVFIAATGGSKFIARSVNEGRSFFNTPQPFADGGLNNRPFLMSPADSRTLFVGYNELFKSSDQGLSWQQISDFQNPVAGWNCGDAIGAIGLTVADTNVLYAGFTNPTWGNGGARLFRSGDGGARWENLTGFLSAPLYSKGITGLTVSPFDPLKCWISFNGYDQDSSGNTRQKVFFSQDGGDSWTDISATLPDLPVNYITGIKGDSVFHILAGNDLGIFLYDGSAGSWKNISNGLPSTLVTDMEVNETSGELIAGTFGRGIWKTAIPEDLKFNKTNPGTSLQRPSCTIKSNPVHSQLQVELSGDVQLEGLLLQVIDVKGKIVETFHPDDYAITLDMGRYPSGLYILRICGENCRISRKFIKD